MTETISLENKIEESLPNKQTQVDYAILSGQVQYDPRKDYNEAIDELTESVTGRGLVGVLSLFFKRKKIEKEFGELTKAAENKVYEAVLEYYKSETGDKDPNTALYIGVASAINEFREAYNRSSYLVDTFGKEGGEAITKMLRSLFFAVLYDENGRRDTEAAYAETKRVQMSVANGGKIEDAVFNKPRYEPSNNRQMINQRSNAA